MTIKIIQLSINNMDVLMCIISAHDMSFMKQLSPNFLRFLSPTIIYEVKYGYTKAWFVFLIMIIWQGQIEQPCIFYLILKQKPFIDLFLFL